MKYFILLCLIVSTTDLNSQNLTFERVGTFTIQRPVEITNTGITGDDRLFVLSKNGSIRIIDNISSSTPTLRTTPYLTITVNTSSEGGLLGLVFDPDFENNGHFYVNYTATVSDTFTSVVSRYTATNHADNTAPSNTKLELLQVRQPNTNHNGGDLAFSKDGYLLIGFGDGGGANDPDENGQDVSTWLGSILRIDVSNSSLATPYTIPSDNPKITAAGDSSEIWSIGWRNPWRITVDPVSGDLIVADVGQGNLEEVDIEPFGTPGGRNYGWDCYEGTAIKELTGCPTISNFTMPVYEYNHNIGRSITGGMVYRGSLYPDLVGKYIFTDYVSSEVFWTMTYDNALNVQVDTQMFNANALSSVAAIGDDSRGELYAAEYSFNGRIQRIKSSAALPVSLSSFAAYADRGYNQIKWSTESEINFDHYVLERSTDGLSFQSLTKKNPLPNNNPKKDYAYKDSNPMDLSYYRLKMVDLDGTITFSDIKKVNRNDSSTGSINIYPNPAREHIFIDNPSGRKMSYSLISQVGSRVTTGSCENNCEKLRISLKNIIPGVYYLQLNDQQSSSSRKVLIIE